MALVDPRDFRSDFTSVLTECNVIARTWIRAAFHDSGTFDSSAKNGGTDGSIQFELDRPENFGLEPTIGFFKDIVQRRGVTMADSIVFGAVEAVKVCGGPDIAFKPGRIDVAGPNPTGRLPGSRVSANETLDIFVNRLGMSVEETVALIGAGHSVAELIKQNNPGDDSVKPGFFDSTPSAMDQRWFAEVLANPENARIEADRNMLDDPEMKRIITRFADPAQDKAFFQPFASGMVKLFDAGAIFDGNKTSSITSTITSTRTAENPVTTTIVPSTTTEVSSSIASFTTGISPTSASSTSLGPTATYNSGETSSTSTAGVTSITSTAASSSIPVTYAVTTYATPVAGAVKGQASETPSLAITQPEKQNNQAGAVNPNSSTNALPSMITITILAIFTLLQ